MKDRTDNGVYYFLGNITSHILHALPLHKELGGTFVVLSERAKKEVEAYGVPVIALDNKPRKWMRFGYRIKPVYHYLQVDESLHKTTDYLNKHAKVVLFYELYDFAPLVRLTKPKTVFLTHGNMLKDYMAANNRVQILEQYNYMAALGPYLRKQFIERDGIPAEKLVDIGIARTDEIVKHAGEVFITDELLQETGIDPAKKIFAYLPTFWGASSIYEVGKEIVRNFPEEYTLIFRPHPQTPRKLIKQYLKILKDKPNVIYAPEGKYAHLGLVDIFNASSAIIGDLSSVMLEAILTRKPLIFAATTEGHQDSLSYAAIAEIVDSSRHITNPTRASAFAELLTTSLGERTNEQLWQKSIAQNFYSGTGTSVQTIAASINQLA